MCAGGDRSETHNKARYYVGAMSFGQGDVRDVSCETAFRYYRVVYRASAVPLYYTFTVPLYSNFAVPFTVSLQAVSYTHLTLPTKA